MTRNVIGLTIQIQSFPSWPLKAQLVVALAQGDIDSIAAVQRQQAELPVERAAEEVTEQKRADSSANPADVAA